MGVPCVTDFPRGPGFTVTLPYHPNLVTLEAVIWKASGPKRVRPRAGNLWQDFNVLYMQL